MATKQVLAYEITADAKSAEQSVGSFRTQLRAATQDLVAMAMKFGDNSVEAQNAGKKVAMLRDAIGDAKAMSDTFNPDKKFVALGGAIQGVVSGFSAYSGAMGLLGSESKDVEKILLKVQSAMALQQGISGIAGAIDSFKLLAGTIKTQVVSAFSSMKSAIMATGLGLLVVAIAAVAAAFSEMADKAQEAADAQDALNESTKRFAEIGLKGEMDYINSKEKLDIAKAKLAGKSESDIFAIQQEARRQRLQAQQREYDESKGIDEKADSEKRAMIKAGIIDGQVAEADHQLALRKISEENHKQSLAEQKKFREDWQASEQMYFDWLDEQNKKKADDEAFVTQLLRDVQYDQDKVKWDAMEKEAADKTFWREWDASEQMYYDDLELTNSQKKVEGYKVLHDIENFLNRERVQQYMDAAETIADIAGRQTVVGKAIAVAITTINTVKGAISAFTGFAEQIPGPVGIALGVVAAAGVVASGVKSVKQILAVKVPGKGIGGGGGSTNIEAPKAPITPQASTTKLDAGSINAVGAATSRSYVLESDVSGNQERITRLNRAARIN